jgi:predicted nucleic acid-binding protein
MHTWPVQDAKARFSEFLDACLSEGSQMVTRRGTKAWLELVAGACNVLPMDAACFRMWARLMHRKSDTLYEDGMIAAAAKVHGLTVVTRNAADFHALGLGVLNPFGVAC